MNTDILLAQLEEARNKYKPLFFKTILVAEAPPDDINRFFYYENVKTADYLFLGIMEVLYPEVKAKYIESKRNYQIKELLLKQFQEEGYYLLDLYELPTSIKTENNKVAISKLVTKIENIYHNGSNIPIVLIKANVYDIAYLPLISRFNIINCRIDFPSCGNQQKFHNKFTDVINQIKQL